MKSGEPNHHFLEEVSAKRKPGFYETLIEYPLIVGRLPYLLSIAASGYHVKGEVYEVDTLGLSCLDGLEGHPDWYRRQSIVVRSLDTSDREELWLHPYAYFMPHKIYRQLYRKGRAKALSWYTCTNQPEPM